MSLMLLDGERAGEERGFIHKKILGLGRGALGAAASLGVPGAGIASAALGLVGGGVSRTGPRSIVNQRGGRGRGAPRAGRPLNLPFHGEPGFGVDLLGGRARLGAFEIPPGLRPKGPGGIVGMFPGVPGGVTGFAEDHHASQFCPPRGFHLNKSSYFLISGEFVPARSRFVRNRKMNAANGRSQDRAIRRLEQGQTQAKKLLKATGFRTISKQSSREMRNARKAVCK